MPVTQSSENAGHTQNTFATDKPKGTSSGKLDRWKEQRRSVLTKQDLFKKVKENLLQPMVNREASEKISLALVTDLFGSLCRVHLGFCT